MTPVVVGLVVVLAAFLRAWNLGSVSFTYDAAAVSNLAADLIDQAILPVHGMVSSVGIQNPPLFVYLLTLPTLFSRDPRMLTGYIALINVVAVYGCYRLGRRYWSAEVGVVAALLFAVSPWAVQHSRGIIAQDLLAPGAVVFLSFLYAWIVDARQWALAAAMITLTALSQLHFASLALAPILAIVFLVQFANLARQRQIRPLWWPLTIGVTVSAALYAPYIAWDASHDWANTHRFVELFEAVAKWRPEVLDLALMNIGGRNIHSLAGAERFRDFLNGIPALDFWPDRIEEAMVVLAAVFLVVRLWHRRRDGYLVRRDGLLLLWLIVPVLFFLQSRQDVFTHYLISLYPAPYLALAAAAAAILAVLTTRPRLRSALRAVVSVSLLVLVAWQTHLSLSIYEFVGTRHTPGGWGTPKRILVEVADRLAQLAQRSGSQQIVVLCPGAEPRWDECPAAFRFLTSGSPLRPEFMDYDNPLLWSHQEDDDTLLLLAPGSSRAAADLPRFAEELKEASVSLREGAGAYRFFRVHNYYRDLAAHLQRVSHPGDAIILNVAGQRPLFDQAYRGDLPIYELPEQSIDKEQTIAQFQELLKKHRRIYGIFRVSEARDPEGVVDGWLSSHTYRTADQWLGPVNFVVYATPGTTEDWVAQPTASVFGDQLRLREYALTPGAIPAGDIVQLRLDWQALRQPDADTMLFVQLLDKDNSILAQRDIILTKDGQPTSVWQPGDETATLVAMAIPASTPLGDHRLIAGLYNPRTGRRLPVNNTDHLDLGPVQIAESLLR